MSTGKFPRYMSNEYLADPANVLSLIAVHLQLANEELADATGLERPREKLAQISRTLQKLADLADKASHQARLWGALSASERDGVREMLRKPQQGPAAGGSSRAEGG